MIFIFLGADDLTLELEANLGIGVPAGAGHPLAVEREEVGELGVEIVGGAEFDDLIAHLGGHEDIAVALDEELVYESAVVILVVEESGHLAERLHLGVETVEPQRLGEVAPGDEDIAEAERRRGEEDAVGVDIEIARAVEETRNGAALVGAHDHLAADAHGSRNVGEERHAAGSRSHACAVDGADAQLEEIGHMAEHRIDDGLPTDELGGVAIADRHLDPPHLGARARHIGHEDQDSENGDAEQDEHDFGRTFHYRVRSW